MPGRACKDKKAACILCKRSECLGDTAGLHQSEQTAAQPDADCLAAAEKPEKPVRKILFHKTAFYYLHNCLLKKLFLPDNQPMTLKQIADESDLNKSTALRMTTTLLNEKFLSYNSNEL